MRIKFWSIFWLWIWVMISVPSLAWSAPAHWEFAGWHGGGCYPNIEFDPNIPGRVYLTSDVAGLWKSDDLGEHWQFITKGLRNLVVPQIAVAASDSHVLYAGTKDGIALSVDAGASWRSVDNLNGRIIFERPGNYRSIAVHPRDPLSVCAGTAKGKVFCSTDQGKTWKDLDPGAKFFKAPRPVSVVFFSADGQYLYTGSADGVAMYDRQASAWTASSQSPRNVTDLLVDEGAPQTFYAAADHDVWVSQDNATSWTKSVGAHPDSIYRLALARQDKATVIYAAANKDWNGRVVRSDNGGLTWQSPSNQMFPDGLRDPTRAWANPKSKISSLKVNPFDPDVIFRTDWWGVWRTDDGGETWVEKIDGAPNSVGSDIVVSADGEIFVATMDNGLLKSSDAGKSYQALFPKSGYKKDSNGHVWRVAVDGRRVVATSSPWGEAVNQVIVSRDGGQTFQLVRDGLPGKRPKVNTMWGEGYPRALAVDPADPNRIYLGIDGDDGGGFFISGDGGLSWTRSAGQPGALRIYNGLVVDVKDPDVIFWAACGDKGGVYKSTDRGQSWTQVFSGSSWVFDLHMSSDGALYAAGSSDHPVVYVSKDQGASWKNVDLPVESSSAADAVITASGNPGLVAVSTVSWGSGAPQKIYLSRDAGKTWADISGDLPPGAGAAAMAFSNDGQFLYISRYAGSVYRVRTQ